MIRLPSRSTLFPYTTLFLFFFNDTATPEIYPLSLHDALPISQFLVSDTRTPDRPDLSSEWNGQKLSSYGAVAWWSHSTKTWDFYTEYDDYGDGFRADNGFVPQVGYRNNYAELGYTWVPKDSFFSRFRVFEEAQYQSRQDGSELYKLLKNESDRKSTRLNSSHQIISYAVFCLKKKKTSKSIADIT